MAKLTLNDVINFENQQSAAALINSNNDAIEAALELTLTRTGTSPNSMEADLDMNSNNILNLPAPSNATQPLRLGDLPDILPTIIEQDDEPATTYTEGSLWIDSNSVDLDVYQLLSSVWTDTGINLKGATGSTGAAGADGSLIFVQNDAPSTAEPEGSLWIDADSTDQDLYQLTSGVWNDTTLNVKGSDGVLAGNVGATDNVIVRSDGTGGVTVQGSGITIDDSDGISGLTIAVIGGNDPAVILAEADGPADEKIWYLHAAAGEFHGAVTDDAFANHTHWLEVNRTGTTIDSIKLLGTSVQAKGSEVLVSSDVGTSVQAFDADTLKADTADVLTAGFATTVFNAGTQSTGTFTPDEANGNFQRAVNGGAHTLAPPTNDCNVIVQYTNNASAGTVTTSGFTAVTGDSLTTTDGHDFLFYITKINGFSHLNVVALQ